MGYFKDRNGGVPIVAWNSDELVKKAALFSFCSYNAALANAATIAFKALATAASYPAGLLLKFKVAANGGPWRVAVGAYNTFTASSFAASSNWRYPRNLNLGSSLAIAGFTCTTATKASTEANKMYLVSAGSQLDDLPAVLLKPGTGYRIQLTNLSGAARIICYEVDVYDPLTLA